MCKIIPNDRQKYHGECSEIRWREHSSKDDNKSYSRKDHRKWEDNSNESMPHFCLHYRCLPTGNIRFDIFHLRCAIKGKLLSCLRFLILKQSRNVVNGLNDVVSIFWSELKVSI